MYSDSSIESSGSDAGPDARSAPVGGAAAASRLVIRDERKLLVPLVSGERSLGKIDTDYEAEIYRLEKRGKLGALIAHPKPLHSANARIAHIDWCAFTVRPTDFRHYRWVMDELARLFGFDQITQRNTGLFGYKHSALIEEGGLIAWGGKHQKGTVYVSLNSQGCARITDWEKLRTWCECHKAKLTRLDLAHDDFEGRIVNMEQSVAWYHAGGFNQGGRKPQTHVAGDWIARIKGRTLYLGERAHGKLTRVYEKGKQQGDLDSPWTRIELELHNKSRVIPLDALTRPAAYLAGAFPCLRYLSAEQCKIKTIQKAAKTAYTKAVEVLRNQYGKLVNVMALVHGGDAMAVVRDIVREGLPARLDPYSYHLRNDPALMHSLGPVGEDHAAVVA